MRFTVVLLAGGQGRRFGSDKLTAPLAGTPLLGVAAQGVLDVAAVVAPHELALPVVVVGPDRPSVPADDRFVVTREDPPGAGPAAAVAAGVRAVPACDVVVVLPGDAPYAASAVPALLRALHEDDERQVDAAVAVDPDGHRQHLLVAARLRALREVTCRGDLVGASARSLLDGLRVVEVAVDARASLDVDDVTDLERAARWT